jgi:hypothetical protein
LLAKTTTRPGRADASKNRENRPDIAGMEFHQGELGLRREAERHAAFVRAGRI